MALEEKERREAEKQKIAAEDSEGEEEEDEEEDLEEEGGSEPVKRKKKRKKSTSVGTVRGGADETDEGDSTTTAPVLPRGDSPNSDSTTDAADVSGEGGDQVAVSVSVSGGATEGGDAAEDAARPSKKAKKAKQGSKNSEYLRLLKAEEALSKRRKVSYYGLHTSLCVDVDGVWPGRESAGGRGRGGGRRGQTGGTGRLLLRSAQERPRRRESE